MFGVEVLVYIYIAVCISMILFNIAIILLNQQRRDWQERHSLHLEKLILEQARALEAGDGPLPDQACRKMARRLERVETLIAFDDAMTRLLEREEVLARRYLAACPPIFVQLCFVYRRREAMQQAYLAYLLSKYEISRAQEMGPLVDYLKEMLRSPSLYSRENALRAFYSGGSAVTTAEAVWMLDRSGFFHHGKLLTDGLLTFEGDHRELAELLWRILEQLRIDNQVAVLNYIRFQGGGNYRERMYAMLLDGDRDPELHYCALRYLGKYPYPPALDTLLEMAESRDERRWNYAAIAATALGSYPGARTVSTLKRALGNANWYVRYNAAQSLELLRVGYLELSDILAGGDRYAREMLQYRMEERDLRTPKEAGKKEVSAS